MEIGTRLYNILVILLASGLTLVSLYITGNLHSFWWLLLLLLTDSGE